MESSCVNQTAIPGTTSLYGDYLYNYERVRRFYPSWFGDYQGLKSAAATLEFPADRRGAIVAALAEQNRNSAALEKLAQPGTVAIVTGQQVGLFSGPIYTIYKALTAVKLAQTLSSDGVPAVPVFWLATEDHDLDEVDHAWTFDRFATPQRLSLRTSPTGGPVGDVVLMDLPLAELEQTLKGFPHGEALYERVTAAYHPGATLGGAFRQFVESLLEEFGLLYLDPLAPGIREIARPFLLETADRLPELIPQLQERSEALVAAGYHAQVNVERETSLLFAMEDGRRLPVRFKEGLLVVRGEVLDLKTVTLSPNALLRPVMQDFLLPTAAYVGGPAEIAYLAQSEVLYRNLLGRMPVPYPRNSFTLVDMRASKILEKYQLRLGDVLANRETVYGKIAAKLVPSSVTEEITKVRATVDGALQRLQLNLKSFDPTLEAATGKSAAKMLYQLDKIGRKTAREMFQRDARASQNTEYLTHLLYPEKHLQERFYSAIPFLAQVGLDLPQLIWKDIQLACPDHMIRSI